MTLETTETPEFPPSACGSTLCVCGGHLVACLLFRDGAQMLWAGLGGRALVGIIALSVGGSVRPAT